MTGRKSADPEPGGSFMRRSTMAVAATAAVAAAITFGTAYADHASTESGTPVVNKNGHEVNEHAAHGQARAAEARAQHESTEDPTEDPTGEPIEDPASEPSEDATDDAT